MIDNALICLTLVSIVIVLGIGRICFIVGFNEGQKSKTRSDRAR